LVGGKYFIALSVEVMEQDGSTVAAGFLSRRGIGSMYDCVAGFPHCEEGFPESGDDIRCPQCACFKVGVSFDIT
jgi:hypothetical protein